jgi:U5 small nuclear ribonucleoprotein component
MTADPVHAIVLHEDKEHYRSADETFGEDVHTAVLDEDAYDLGTPLVRPVQQRTHHVGEDDDDHVIVGGGGGGFRPAYSDDFLTNHLLSNETTATRRGVAIVGHLHHGKTTLVDMWFESSLEGRFDPVRASRQDDNRPRYTDHLKAERQRQMSLSSTPMTLPLTDTRGKSYAFTVVDCPGHVQFHDESVASLRLVDGCVLCVDCVEGVMLHTELLIRQAVAEGLPVVLCITKLDRFLTELHLPPRDAYYKLLNVIESVNRLLHQSGMGRYPPGYLCPTKNNVVFSSAIHGWSFTLQSWAQTYLEHNENGLGPNVTIDQFASKLWGDQWFDPSSKTFVTDPQSTQAGRSFVRYVLEPIYKIYTTCLGESQRDVVLTMKSLGVILNQEEIKSFSTRPLVRTTMSKFMELANSGFVDSIVQHM